MNSFTDAQPSFPFESSEARRRLGLPDSSEIHLAVTDLAERLLPIAAISRFDGEKQRIAALRTASGAVLFGWSLARAEREVCLSLDIPIEPAEPVDEAIEPGKRWLAEAAAQLFAEGVAVRSNYQTQRTPYGWRQLGESPTGGAECVGPGL